MTLSRMDEEESPLKLSDFAVSEAVEETAESFRDFARSQGHSLELAHGMFHIFRKKMIRFNAHFTAATSTPCGSWCLSCWITP